MTLAPACTVRDWVCTRRSKKIRTRGIHTSRTSPRMHGPYKWNTCSYMYIYWVLWTRHAQTVKNTDSEQFLVEYNWIYTMEWYWIILNIFALIGWYDFALDFSVAALRAPSQTVAAGSLADCLPCQAGRWSNETGVSLERDSLQQRNWMKLALQFFVENKFSVLAWVDYFLECCAFDWSCSHIALLGFCVWVCLSFVCRLQVGCFTLFLPTCCSHIHHLYFQMDFFFFSGE